MPRVEAAERKTAPTGNARPFQETHSWVEFKAGAQSGFKQQRQTGPAALTDKLPGWEMVQTAQLCTQGTGLKPSISGL